MSWTLKIYPKLPKYHHLGHKTSKKIFPKKVTIFSSSLRQELSSKVLNTFRHAQLAKKNTVLQNQKMNIVVYTWRNKIYVRFLPFLLSGPKSLLRGRFELWKVPRAPLVAKRIILCGFQVLLAKGGGSKATEAVSPAPDARPWPFFCCLVGSALPKTQQKCQHHLMRYWVLENGIILSLLRWQRERHQ